MSTLTTLGASDSGSTSRTTINNNFTALNDDKAETLSDLGVTASAAEVNIMDGVTTSTAELNFVDGVTSAIQTQINTKAPTASPTFTGTVTLPTGLTGVVRADSGVVSIDSDVTDIVAAATDAAAGKVELATDAETLTATSDVVVMTPGNFGANIVRLYKSADETVNDSVVLQNDNHLSFAVSANEVWAFELFFAYLSGTTPDIKIGWTYPAGTTMLWRDGGGQNPVLTESSTPMSAGSASTLDQFYRGVIIVSGTAGTIQFQWAQNTQNATDTTIKKGAWLIAHRIA